MKHGSPFSQTTPRTGDGAFQNAVDEMKEAANRGGLPLMIVCAGTAKRL